MANPFLKKTTVTPTTIQQEPQQVKTEQPVDDIMVDTQKKRRSNNQQPSRSITKEDKQFILANFTKMSNSQMAKHLGLKDQQISAFFAKMKKDIKKVLDDPNASKQDKEKMLKLQEFLNQPREYETKPIGKKKTASEVVNDYEDLFKNLK